MTVGVGLPAGLQQRRALRKTNRPAWNAADDFVVLTVDEPQLAKKHAHPSPSDRASSPTTLTHSSHVSLSSPNRPSSRGSSGSESSWRSSRTRQPPAACDERNEQVGTFKSLDPAAGHISVKSSIRSGSRHDEESGDAESSKGRDCATGCHNLSILTEASSGDDDPKDDSYSIRHVKSQRWTANPIMPSGTSRSLMLPHILDEKLKSRFIRGGVQTGLGGFKDPAQATIEKLMRTRHVARIARLGDGAYGGKRRTPIRVFKPPPVADLGSALDECNSDEEDECLNTDDLVGNLMQLPLTSTRMQILSSKTDDLQRPMTTGYTQWPPLVAPRATYGGLQNDEQHSSAIARHIVTHKAEDAETNGPEHHSQRGPFYPSGASASTSSLHGTALSSAAAPHSSSHAAARLQHVGQRIRNQSPPAASISGKQPTSSQPTGTAGGFGEFRGSTAPATVPTKKQVLQSMGQHAWINQKGWRREANERVRTAYMDRNLEEGIDVSIARMRLQSHPFRHCYDKTHFLNASMDNREITMASEAGPEIGNGPLARHYAQTSTQVQTEMVVFKRRMESLLGASPSLSSLNLSSCLSGERQFKLLLVALPSYPTVREIKLCKNGLDDGHVDALVDKLLDMASVTSLDLSENRLTWISASKLASMLTVRQRHVDGGKHTLKKLKVNGNHLGNRGADLIAEAMLSNNKGLETLGLSKCGIGSLGGQKIGQVLSEVPTVANLDLSWNELGCHGAEAVLSGVQFSPSLLTLDLSHNYFGDKAATAVAGGLSQNEKLRYIDLSSNFLGQSTCIALGRAFKENHSTTLQMLVMDDNPCTAVGAGMLLSSLATAPEQLKISLKRCSFEKSPPKADFDPEEPDGQYRFRLDDKEHRAAAMALLEARNSEAAAAWHVSRLNGKQFQPPGPWDAQPPPGVEQRGGAQQNNSKGKKDGKGGKDGRGKDKAAGKGGSGRKKEEEEVVMDPWDPRVALPQEGELLVEYRSVCMPPFDPEGKDEASQGSLSGVSREAFDRIWAPEQVAGETDLWRLGYVHAMCTRFRLTSEQAASTLKTFTHSKERVLAAQALLHRLVTYRRVCEIHEALSEAERTELYSATGLLRLLDHNFPTGRYMFDLRLRLHNCAANLLQHLWRREKEESWCKEAWAGCWRNVTLDNKPAKPSPASRLPFRGKLEFDYVSWRSIRPGEPGGSPLSKNAFDYMMKELASKTSTAAAPGEMHFVDLVLQAQAGKYHGPKEEAGEATEDSDVSASQSPHGGRYDMNREESQKKMAEGSMAGSSSNGLDAIRAAVEELSARKDIAPPPYFAKALKKAQRTSQGFVEPYKALHLIKAVVSRHALVFEQLLAILQCFKGGGAALRVEALKKLSSRTLGCIDHMSDILLFSLTEEERAKVVRDMGILRVINWDHPNSEYVLSMREDDQRYCLFRLLRMSVSEGSLDARMMEQLRVDGELVPRRGFQRQELWAGLLGASMWDKIKLRLKSTGAKMTGMRERQGSGPGASSASSFRGDAALPLDAVQGKAEESPEDPAEEGGAIEEGDSLLVPIPDSGPALEEDREAGEMNGDAVKMAAGEKRRRRELERLSRATVEFTYEASPEAKLGEVCLLVCGHWKQWALRKREAREAQAVYKIIMWYTNIKRRKEMADMQELLDLQRRNEEIIP